MYWYWNKIYDDDYIYFIRYPDSYPLVDGCWNSDVYIFFIDVRLIFYA